MELIEYLTIRVYALSWLEFFLFILFFSFFYLVLKKYVSIKSKKIWNFINISLLILFTLFVIYKVLLNRETGNGNGNAVMIPFLSYYKYFRGDSSEALIMNRANILLFIPYGLFFFDLIKTKKRVILFIILSFASSLILEILQYFLALGTFEIDDIIHNTVGAYLGYLLCLGWNKILIYNKLLAKLKLNE